MDSELIKELTSPIWLKRDKPTSDNDMVDAISPYLDYFKKNTPPQEISKEE